MTIGDQLRNSPHGEIGDDHDERGLSRRRLKAYQHVEKMARRFLRQRALRFAAAIPRLQELAVELHALYADVPGPQRLALDRKITGTICELLRLDERMRFQDAPKSAARRTA